MSDSKQKMLEIKYVEGNLFNSQDALAHCVSLDFKMGAGIALAFHKIFGQVEKLKSQVKSWPGLGILEHKSRSIFYLVTKEKFYQKPTYEAMEACLKLLQQQIVLRKISKLSIPFLGCGLDKLDWTRVEEMIKDVFKETDIEITVYYL